MHLRLLPVLSACISTVACVLLSEGQFKEAIQCYGRSGRGYPPLIPDWSLHYQQYRDLVGDTMDAQEQAMFLANALWETGGLQWLEEQACRSGGCAYGWFYGRGLLQLTWQSNYEAASEAIHGDARLCSDPNLVATQDAWSSALWYWRARVQPKDTFGQTIHAINGAIECPASDAAWARWRIYAGVCEIFGIQPTDLTGC